MKFSYKFSNLLGAAYKKGNILFTSDGNSVISPVCNKINIFDLRNNKICTLPIESRFNYVALDISPNGCILIAINEEGEAHMISLISQTILHSYRFKGKVRCIKFSPDGKYFAVCKDNNVFVFKAPGQYTLGNYNPFVMERVFHSATDETTCLAWSDDSKFLAAGSKDMSIKVYTLEKFSNFRFISLRNHTDEITGCFFEKDSYDIITLSRNGQMCLWECNMNAEDLIPAKNTARKFKKIKQDDEKEDDIDPCKIIEQTEAELSKALDEVQIKQDADEDKSKVSLFSYKKLNRFYLADEVKKDDRNAILTSVDYHSNSKILTVGFSNGSFYIYEMPDVTLVHSLNISSQKISAITFNRTGDWIALGCSSLGQLLVWEWQSETYIMKQQGHSNNVSCVSYSIDGEILASGGEDGKVKLWNVNSGLCFITFSEHTSAVNAIRFSGNKRFVVSASLDGTVRAYDVIRYRNFRTFAAQRPVQFVSVAVDVSGEFVAAGAQDIFEIYLWSVKTGKLLEILNGHEGPVGSLDFSPLPSSSSTLVSVSWDKTLKIWDAIEKGSSHETIELTADGIHVAFNPKGHEVAVATLDGHIHFFNVRTSEQVTTIEGREDLGSGVSDTDLISAKKSLEAKSFTSLCYSADGEFIIAGGQSKNVCIYNVRERILVKKFEITQNRSLDTVDDFINRRKLTEFGNLALVEEREEREGGHVNIRLPGVKKGDMSSRSMKPEVRVFSLQFSPTGQQWSAATTEGILIYSMNSGIVFDPWDLQIGITPASIKQAIQKGEYTEGLTMAMKLNEADLIKEAMESIPVKDVELIIGTLSIQYIERLIVILAEALVLSRHLEYYLNWVQLVLTIHGPAIRTQKNMPAILALEKILVRRYQELSKICDHNKYTMQYISRLGKVKSLGRLDSDDNDNLFETD